MQMQICFPERKRLTATTSKLWGEGIRIHRRISFTAISTPPPREDLSLRCNV